MLRGLELKKELSQNGNDFTHPGSCPKSPVIGLQLEIGKARCMELNLGRGAEFGAVFRLKSGLIFLETNKKNNIILEKGLISNLD